MKKLVVILAVLGLFRVSADCQRHKPFAAARYMFSQFFSGRSPDGMVVISSELKPSVSLMAVIEPITDDSGVVLLPEDYYPSSEPVITPVPPATETQSADEALQEAYERQQELLRQLEQLQRQQHDMIQNIIRNLR